MIATSSAVASAQILRIGRLALRHLVGSSSRFSAAGSEITSAVFFTSSRRYSNGRLSSPLMRSDISCSSRNSAATGLPIACLASRTKFGQLAARASKANKLQQAIVATETMGLAVTASIQVEFFELTVLGPDPAHRAGDRAHHNGLSLDHLAAEFDALEERAGGDAGRRKEAVALHHVLNLVFLARILDGHLERALALLFGVEDRAALHLSADAA